MIRVSEAVCTRIASAVVGHLHAHKTYADGFAFVRTWRRSALVPARVSNQHVRRPIAYFE